MTRFFCWLGRGILESNKPGFNFWHLHQLCGALGQQLCLSQCPFLCSEMGWKISFTLEGFLRAEGWGLSKSKSSLGAGPRLENCSSLKIQSSSPRSGKPP